MSLLKIVSKVTLSSVFATLRSLLKNLQKMCTLLCLVHIKKQARTSLCSVDVHGFFLWVLFALPLGISFSTHINNACNDQC